MKEYLIENIRGLNFVTIELGDTTLTFSRNAEGLWIRHIWGAVAFFNDSQLAGELANDYSHLSISEVTVY